ncbi:RES family NAD+ phosphorylase [Mycobacterium sp. pUA109]|uniref:RES family NAD+ phosphorylase n=1 Tax=Mycobacterium sp. pUA109 TaxID=3238982 RepID=UPI00351B64F9
MTRLRPVPPPDSGAVRVHPAPEALPQLRHEGPGRNRFDDPHGRFLMRYTAESLRGCLVETMARFRPSPAADALLAAVEFVDADVDPPVPAAQAVAEWLAAQRVGRVTLVTPQPLLVDIEAADLLVDLDTHPLVREAIDNSPLRDGPTRVHLDAGLVRLGGDVGRPITQQAISRALHELHPEVDGIAYWSRIDPSERCWAIFGHVPVDVAIADLSAENPVHRSAVQEVADLLRVPLPRAWR